MNMTEDNTLIKTSGELRLDRLKGAAAYFVFALGYVSIPRLFDIPHNPIITPEPSPLPVDVLTVILGAVAMYSLLLLWQKAGLWLGAMEVDAE